MQSVHPVTDIVKIGLIKRNGSENFSVSKTFTLNKKPDYAVIQLESQSACGIYINGAFLEGTTGRYSNRVCAFECTSFLKEGTNEITIAMCNHYYQPTVRQIFENAGAIVASVAAEIVIDICGSKTRITTDESWTCTSDDGQTVPESFIHITEAQYKRFWHSAAIWKEHSPKEIPEAIRLIAGEDYCNKAMAPSNAFVKPEKIYETNLIEEDGVLSSKGSGASGEEYVIYDYGKLYVGYVEMDYYAESDGNIAFLFDYTESVKDFTEKTIGMHVCKREGMLTIETPIQKGHNSLRLIRRRACHYMKLIIESEGKVSIKNIGFRTSMLPSDTLGMFECSDSLINDIWEAGKYTLQVSKHHEYESCPRNEMKYFSGDGIIQALSDTYAFGDNSLVEASFSLTEISGNGGIVYDILRNNEGLWDYPGWRIITAYNYYLYYKDVDFVKRYFEELIRGLEWMIEKANQYGLIFQIPIFGDVFYMGLGPVEFTSSEYRYGEKTLLNAVFYKCLLAMSEFADICGDERGELWREYAKKVKKAFNDRLWSEEDGAYLDTFDPSYIPQDGNSLAVLYGLSDKERSKRVLDTLVKRNHSPYGSAILSRETGCEEHTRYGQKSISPVTCTYEAEARFLNGDADGGVDLIRRTWGTMLKKGAKTYWEFSPNNPDDLWIITCHAWSSGCTYVLSAYVLGIRPKSPGYESVVFEPYAGFDHFTGVVPTVKGLMAVKCVTEGDNKVYDLAVPLGTKLDIRLPEKAKVNITEY